MSSSSAPPPKVRAIPTRSRNSPLLDHRRVLHLQPAQPIQTHVVAQPCCPASSARRHTTSTDAFRARLEPTNRRASPTQPARCCPASGSERAKGYRCVLMTSPPPPGDNRLISEEETHGHHSGPNQVDHRRRNIGRATGHHRRDHSRRGAGPAILDPSGTISPRRDRGRLRTR